MLSRPRLGNDAFLAHTHCQKNLAKGVVDLVRARVSQVFPFEVCTTANPF
jgi:hypothetical protein